MLSLLPHLEEGSTVDIIAPASACPRRDLKLAVRFVKALGLKPRVSPRIFGKTEIMANTDDERFKQLQRALWSTDSDAVWCIRGGYGSIRLLPKLAKLKRPRKFKLILGYSDITTLHMFLNSEWKWPTIHSPMVGRFGRGDASKIELHEVKSILFGPAETFNHRLVPLNKPATARRTIKTAIVGGNLATLQGSMGTPWTLNPDKHIIFFEDIAEKPHKMDRMLTQFEQAGYFRRAQAVIFGDMTVDSAKERRLIWNEVIPRFAREQKIPVLKGLQAGHGKINRPIPFLTKTQLRLGKSPELDITLRPAR